MTLATDYRHIGIGFLAVVSTAVLLWFGNGLAPWWPLMWFAPLPVLLFASRTSWWGAALAAFLSSLIGSLSMWQYFRGPLVGPFAHVGRGRDGVDGNDFIDAIGDTRHRFICVHGLELALHDCLSRGLPWLPGTSGARLIMPQWTADVASCVHRGM